MIQFGGNLVLNFNESSFNGSFDHPKILPTVHWNPAPRDPKKRNKNRPLPWQAQKKHNKSTLSGGFNPVEKIWVTIEFFLRIGVKLKK